MPSFFEQDPKNPYLPSGGQQLSQLLMSLGAGFSMAGANNQPWWAGIAPGAAMYGQAQQQAQQNALAMQQRDENLAYRKLQEDVIRENLAAKRAEREAASSYVPPGAPSMRLPQADGSAPPVGMAVPPKPPVMGGGQNVNIPQAATAIGKIEGDYNSVGPVANAQGNRAYGKYQVMDFNIGPWTKEVLGTAMTPEQFLADRGAQDAVFNSKFGNYAAKYGPEGAARAWFAGEGGMNNPNATDVLGTTVAGYGRKFADLYGMQNPEAPPESYRGPGTNPLPPVPMPVPPPPTVPGAGPSPIVQVGGSALDIAGPMPVVPNVPQPDLTPEEASRLQAMRKSGVPEHTVNQEAYSLINKRWEANKAAAMADYQQRMKVWDLKRSEAQRKIDEASKAESFRPARPDEIALYTNGQPPQPGTVYQVNTKTNQMTVSGAPLVNMPAGESTALKVQIEAANKAHTEQQESAKAARSGLAQINRVSDLMDQISTGKFASTTLEIKAMAKSLGIDLGALGIKDDVGPAQAADALSKQLTLAMRDPSSGGGMPGAMSDADRIFLSKMVPTLETSPEGRKMIVEYAKRMYQRQIDLAKIANDYLRSKEFANDPSGMYAKMQEYADKNPLFSDKNVPAGGMSPAPAGAIPQGGDLYDKYGLKRK